MTFSYQRLLPIIALTILTLLFFYKLAFTDMILARGDTYNYFYPYWDVRNAAMLSGNLPLWTPDIFMGVPLLANPQLGTFYPPNWLTIPFTAPDAIRISIVMHIFWAALGILLLFREVISQSLVPALIAAIIFAFGGYLSAHVEQINQLQGLSWLPWLCYLYHRFLHSKHNLHWFLLLTIGWALQIFSGHTQTVFMTGIALGIDALITALKTNHQRFKAVSKNIIMLILATIIVLLLASPQLLPTLELTGMSNRGGGFNVNQATAFSLPPTYLGRALLPSYDGQLFTEYIGYIGVIALGLAIYGVISPIQNKSRPWAWLIITLLGLFFALGRFNPLYWYIAELPGFNLFRVPARWLALYAFGISMLAGYGVLALQSQTSHIKRMIIPVSIVLLLMLIGRFAPILPSDIVGFAQPTVITLLAWALALLIFISLNVIKQYKYMPMIVLLTISVELFFASSVLPYNDLAPRDVYLGQRFTISQMLAYNQDEQPPSRMLSISGRLFNLGDISTLEGRYNNYGMDAQAQQTAFTALKNQEIIFPNLGLTWQIPTIDGYGGGLLPTIYYSQFTSLLLPDGTARTVDGRIGETLAQSDCRGACIPDLTFLQMTDTQYIVADKNFDVPHQGIFYDTSLAEYWFNPPAEPNFIFDEVHVLHLGTIPNIDSEVFPFQGTDYSLTRITWDELDNLLVNYHQQVLAISVVESRTNTFLQLTPQPFERVLSSDIKIYRINPTIRASFATNLATTPDDWAGHEEALFILQDVPDIQVVHDAPLLEGIDPSEGSIEFLEYSATSITLNVNVSSATYLFLADAYYPGWQATLNGEAVPVYRANVMFRAVPVPAGESTVTFEFVPTLWYWAIGIGSMVWIILTMLLAILFLRNRNQEDEHND